MLSGSLLIQRGMSSGYRWRQPLDIDGTCEYIE